jgi:hypothetical protein
LPRCAWYRTPVDEKTVKYARAALDQMLALP